FIIQKQNSREKISNSSDVFNKQFASARDEPLGGSDRSIHALIEKYDKLGDATGASDLLRRWEKKFMSNPDPALLPGKMYVLKSIIVRLASTLAIDESYAYLNRLSALDHSIETRIFVAVERARISRIAEGPDQGLKACEYALQLIESATYGDKLVNTA